ncbi:hypothetical protein [Victivallis lenta]|uniref:hypothetical protein n=1 Tax=Victivallis lenta TaxID=2606640 RepID=UPI00131A53D2|nr:hypothetical protein [Victivallis lenta]
MLKRIHIGTLALFLCASVGAKEHVFHPVRDLTRFVKAENVMPHETYNDLLIPGRGDNSFMIYVGAENGKKVSCMEVSTAISTSSPAGPYLFVEYSENRQGKWIPLYLQRGVLAGKVTRHTERVANLRAFGYWLRFSIHDAWSDGKGKANFFIRDIRMKTEDVDFPAIVFENNLNVFTDRQQVVFHSGWEGLCEIRDHLGRIAARPIVQFGRCETEPLKPGFYHVWNEKTEIGRFAVVEADLQERAAGSIAQLDLGKWGRWPVHKSRRIAELARLAGVTLVRSRPGAWIHFEPERGQYNMQAGRTELKLEKQQGLNIITALHGLTSWRCSGNGRDVPFRHNGYADDLRDIYRTCRQLGTSYRSLIDVWEFWNEPDATSFGAGPAHNYAAAMKAAALGFRDSDPAKQYLRIACGAPSSIAREWFIRDALDNGIGGYFDIYNSHIYHDSAEYRYAYTRHRRIIRDYRLHDKEKWITEGGVESVRNDTVKNPIPHKGESQVKESEFNTAKCDNMPEAIREKASAELIRNYVLSAAYGWQKYCQFSFAYYNEDKGFRMWGMLAPGLIATSGFAALANYNRFAGTGTYVGCFSNAPRETDTRLVKVPEAHLFKRESDWIAVLWDESGPSKFKLHNLIGLFALTGEELLVPENGEIELTSIPVYARLSAPPNGLMTQENTQFRNADFSKVSRIVLDFVRDPEKTNPPYDPNYRYLLQREGQIITGELDVYNFSDAEWHGTVDIELPKGWKSNQKMWNVRVPAGGRESLRLTITAGKYSPDTQQVLFRTDRGKSVAVMNCRFSQEVSFAEKTPLKNLACEGIAPSHGTLDGTLLSFDFQGNDRFVRLIGESSRRDSNGFVFSLIRRGPAGFNWIDANVYLDDGSVCRLFPNIFPVFNDVLDNQAVHAISYSQLVPPAVPEKVKRIELLFSGNGKFSVDFSQFSEWKAKK